jgi:hypothetical protein
VDLKGKGGHVRTIPVPDWVKASIDSWAAGANITSGPLFRSINKAGTVWGNGFTPKVVWSIMKANAKSCGFSTLPFPRAVGYALRHNHLDATHVTRDSHRLELFALESSNKNVHKTTGPEVALMGDLARLGTTNADWTGNPTAAAWSLNPRRWPVGSRTGAVFRRSSLACCSPFPVGVPQ